jgi:hypothetical protein
MRSVSWRKRRSTAVGQLIFDGEAARELYDHARSCSHHRKAYGRDPEPALWLVHDQGVYLMSSGIPHLERPDKPEASKVVYAQDCNPDVDEDWWDNARDLVGGDDFVEAIALDIVERVFKLNLDFKLVIDLSDDKFTISYIEGGRARTKKVRHAPPRRTNSGIDELDIF